MVALDFSNNDLKLISHAIGQGNKDTTYVLIHIVESAASRLMEKDTYDMETRNDQKHLDSYVQQLKEKGSFRLVYWDIMTGQKKLSGW